MHGRADLSAFKRKKTRLYLQKTKEVTLSEKTRNGELKQPRWGSASDTTQRMAQRHRLGTSQCKRSSCRQDSPRELGSERAEWELERVALELGLALVSGSESGLVPGLAHPP